MDVTQLKTLRMLDQLGSLRAVAQALYVSPSAVSQHLTQLQQEAGEPLTRKVGRRLELTEAGRRVSDAAQAVFSAMEVTRATLHGAGTTETVKVSMFHSVGPVLAPALMPLPNVMVSDEDVSMDDFPALTISHDVVVAHRVDDSEPWPTTVSSVELLREPFDIALPWDHPLAKASELKPEDLAEESWVSSRPGYSPADIVRHVSAAAHHPVKVVHRINDYATVAALVAAGAGSGGGVVAALPRHTAASLAPSGVVLRPMAGRPHERVIEALCQPQALHRPAVAQVLSTLKEALEHLAE
ncbi:LysR family transcriptional regulator [Galactobacter sp.]|uniref:LysR family transcriptional regulator n=1 Tax=Galactobacter sp. TaxID=2676125 RepID=UPI0025C3D9D0|nr:LysR family transcriptional regulator [Galactobacter sp.]